MPATRPHEVAPERRKRKAHTKSRGGCVNCKMRKVKCDEVKPFCQRCQAFGVSCTYDRAAMAMQPYKEAAFIVDMPQVLPSMNQTVLGMLNDSLRRQDVKNRAFQLSTHDLELINKFHERTSLTIGNTSNRHLYQREGVRLAFQYPFLMHIVLTMTMMHDRSIGTASPKQTAKELFHWYQGTSQFNTALHPLTRTDLAQSEKDAIWVTAALLGCTSIAQVDGEGPEEVWPLKTPSPSDLDWLKMSDGKKEIWRITELHRPDSAFHELTTMAAMDDFMIRTSDREAFANLPPELLDMCGLNDANASEANNPFYRQAATLGRLVPVAMSQATILKFLTFLGLMPPEYHRLLEAKDPRAMVLLLRFYMKASTYQGWWWWKRASLEGQAMCIYLETYHSDVPGMAKVLEEPKLLFMGSEARVNTLPGLLLKAGTEAEASGGPGASVVLRGLSPRLSPRSETEGSTSSGTLM